MSATTRWFLTTLLSVTVAVGSTVGTIHAFGFTAGSQTTQIESIEGDVNDHLGDDQIHLSIHSQVALEKRLGSLETSIKALTVTIEERLP